MTEKNILFSVIIPTHNRAGLVTRAIESILKQTLSDFEILVIDDGSTDSTREVIEKLKQPKLTYYYQENSERGAARNKGVEISKGDYVVFLDSDDFLYPDFLKNASESLRKYNLPGFLFMGFEFVDEDGNKKGRSDQIHNNDITILVKGNPLGCVGAVLRKDVARELRFMETKELFSGEDWELWLRVSAKYGLKADNRISAGALLHKNRSMNRVDIEKLVNSKSLLLKHAFSNENVQKQFGKYYRRIEAYCDTFIALHLVLGGYKTKGLKYWFKGVCRSPRALFSKRTAAIFKRIITG